MPTSGQNLFNKYIDKLQHSAEMNPLKQKRKQNTHTDRPTEQRCAAV